MIAEDLLDRLDLGGIGEDRRGRVGIDVVDLLRGDARLTQSAAHDPHLAFDHRLGQPRRITGRHAAQQLGMDPRVTRPRAGEGLEDDRPRALAGHESLAPCVEGPAGMSGGVGERLPHERIHQRPTLQRDRIQLLRGGRDHHGVHAARAQEVDRAQEGGVAARAGIADHVVGALDGQQFPDLTEHVGVPEHHPQEGIDGIRVLVKGADVLHEVVVVQIVAAGHVPDTLGIEPGIVQTGVEIGLQGRGAGQPPGQGRGAQDLARACDQGRGISRPDPLEVRAQVELTHVAADLGPRAFVHVLPVRDSGTARPKRGAELGRGLPDGGHDPHAGHDHAAHVIAPTVRTHLNAHQESLYITSREPRREAGGRHSRCRRPPSRSEPASVGAARPCRSPSRCPYPAQGRRRPSTKIE